MSRCTNIMIGRIDMKISVAPWCQDQFIQVINNLGISAKQPFSILKKKSNVWVMKDADFNFLRLSISESHILDKLSDTLYSYRGGLPNMWWIKKRYKIKPDKK